MMHANFSPMALNYSAAWDRSDNKIFENCLVEIPDCVERWKMIARRIPGKSPEDVRVHYEALLFDVGQIDSGKVEPPSYPDETVSLGWDDRSRSRDSVQISFASAPAQSRHLEVVKKKGVRWTEHEHRLFLIGLKRYGKGDWKNISRNVVISKTPSQVSSHAQKYFRHQSDGEKETKGYSIHNITTTIDSLTVPAQPNLPVPDQTSFQHFQSQHL